MTRRLFGILRMGSEVLLLFFRRVTKSVLLDTGLPGPAGSRKRPAGGCLVRGVRRFFSLFGGRQAENETGFRFFGRAKARRACVWSIRAGSVSWSKPAWAEDSAKGVWTGLGGGAPRLARTSTRRRRRLARSAPRRGAEGWVGPGRAVGAGGGGRVVGIEMDSAVWRSAAEPSCRAREAGAGSARCRRNLWGRVSLGGPGCCPPLVLHKELYVKAKPGGGEWRAGRGYGQRPLPESPPCVCAAPAGARGGQLPGRRAGESLGMPRHGAGPEGGGNGRGRVGGRLGGRAGGTEDGLPAAAPARTPGLVDPTVPSASRLSGERKGAVRRSALRGADLRGEGDVATDGAKPELLGAGGGRTSSSGAARGLAGEGGVCVSVLVGEAAVQVDGGA